MYYVYMLASKRNGTIYTGVTNSLVRRIGEHKDKRGSKFARRYDVGILVWYQEYDQVALAIAREKQINGWNRAWKLRLIEQHNSG